MLSDEELEKLEAPNPEFVREIPQMYLDGLVQAEKDEAEAKAKAEEEKAALEADVQSRINLAVEEALSQYKSKGGSVKSESSGSNSESASASNIDVNWANAASRDVTLFYPGQASIEWVLNGRDHGGARPFEKGGDRCVTCHDNETADMGQKIVTGENCRRNSDSWQARQYSGESRVDSRR